MSIPQFAFISMSTDRQTVVQDDKRGRKAVAFQCGNSVTREVSVCKNEEACDRFRDKNEWLYVIFLVTYRTCMAEFRSGTSVNPVVMQVSNDNKVKTHENLEPVKEQSMEFASEHVHTSHSALPEHISPTHCS